MQQHKRMACPLQTLVQPQSRAVWRFAKKLRVEPSYDPTIWLLGLYPEKTVLWKDTCPVVLTATLFTRAKTWKQLKCSLTSKWIKICISIYIYIYHILYYTYIYVHQIYTMEYYSTIKKNEITPFVVKQMDLEIFILSEVSRIKINIIWITLVCGL